VLPISSKAASQASLNRSNRLAVEHQRNALA
jgi:hypothetical protein